MAYLNLLNIQLISGNELKYLYCQKCEGLSTVINFPIFPFRAFTGESNCVRTMIVITGHFRVALIGFSNWLERLNALKFIKKATKFNLVLRFYGKKNDRERCLNGVEFIMTIPLS